MESWLNGQLAELLGFPSTEEITSYILSLESVSDQESYLLQLLDSTNETHRACMQEFTKRAKGPRSKAASEAPQGMKAYKKGDDDQDQEEEKKANKKAKELGTKGKTKFVALNSSAGKTKDAVQLSGRHPCECQSSKHPLVNNCTACGRVVCAQEGSGPCLFCGALVATKEEMEVLARGSKKSEQLRQRLMKAEEMKRTLLEFDKNSEKRTKVIDDESDYFATDANKWLTQEQREALKKREEELREQRHGSRLNRNITFDFAGRRVVESESSAAQYDPSQDEVVKKIMEMKVKEGSAGSFMEVKRKTLNDGDGVVNPFLKTARPMIVETGYKKSNAADGNKPSSSNAAAPSKMRLQDAQLQTMSDDGVCLSMHQPYASLLVAGIKIHEGRTWYSAHRGRLWIHAASKVPTEAETAEVEGFYKKLYGRVPAFPSSYPTGCLLGCVDVVDVLSQEDYREKFPEGESLSPYVFVCENPQEMLVKYPMGGQHKIYKLDPNIHKAAKTSHKTTTSAAPVA